MRILLNNNRKEDQMKYRPVTELVPYSRSKENLIHPGYKYIYILSMYILLKQFIKTFIHYLL